MAEFTAYKLQMVSPYHSSSQGIGIEATDLTVRSDTLFSALASAVRAVAGTPRLVALLDQARVDPPFALSSTFPWANRVRFFPRPRRLLGLKVSGAEGSDPAGDAERGEQAQAVAKAPWLSQGVLERLIGGRKLTLAESATDARHGVWYLQTEQADLPAPTSRGATRHQPGRRDLWWASEPVPRVTVDRLTSRSTIYRCGRAWYGPEAGLWFLAEWRDRSWEATFDDALDYLSESGLGGERTAGHGQFRVIERAPLVVADRPDGGGFLTLSLYHPTAAETRDGVLASPAAYELESRRGWVTSPEAGQVWRRSVRMVAEGAIVRRVAPRLGDLVDVTPDGPAPHPVYRAGFAVGLGVDLAEEAT